MSARTRQPVLNTELLRQRLTLRNVASERKLLEAHATAKEFFEKVGLRPGKIREHAAKLLTSGALAGTLLLSAPVTIPLAGTPSPDNAKTTTLAPTSQLQHQMSEFLKANLPPIGDWKLPPEKEKKISQKLQEIYGIKAFPELDSNRLPNSYGRMGAEQHLPRFPGDTAADHEELVEKGITPGLGGWGYFAYSRAQLTQELIDTEKYYVAVQTLYIPDWNVRTKYYVDWFKYRHVIVVNPENGKAIVAAVADAGPAAWTGKHFGGSPELMAYLGINVGMQNHPVVLFFLDDPKKEIPLGPLEYNTEVNQKILANKT